MAVTSFSSLPSHLVRRIFAYALNSSEGAEQAHAPTRSTDLALVCHAWNGSTQKLLATPLPAELWLEVMVDDEIDIGALKRLSRVSNMMRRLTQVRPPVGAHGPPR